MELSGDEGAARIRGRSRRFAGAAAEDRAAAYYAERGARILARNWRASREEGGGEIDLVVAEAGAIVFVEVKQRRSIEAAAAAIRPAQWSRLEAAAEAFMLARGAGACDLRFDAVLMDRSGRIEVVENARRI